MIIVKLQLLGGRGSSSGGSGGGGSSNSGGGSNTFKNETEFEKSLTGMNDPRLQEYSDALAEGSHRVGEINSLNNQASNEGLGEWTKAALEGEREQAQERLNRLPSNMTPAQLGEAKGLKDTIEAIDNILSITPSGNSSQEDVNIVI